MTAAVMAPALWLKLWASTLAVPPANTSALPERVRLKGAATAWVRARP